MGKLASQVKASAANRVAPKVPAKDVELQAGKELLQSSEPATPEVVTEAAKEAEAEPIGSTIAATDTDVVKLEAEAEAMPAPADGFKVEMVIAMPGKGAGGGRGKYPWDTMPAGGSFYVPGAKAETFYSLCSSAKKKYEGKVFEARKWEEGTTKGVRVWRTK